MQEILFISVRNLRLMRIKDTRSLPSDRLCAILRSFFPTSKITRILRLKANNEFCRSWGRYSQIPQTRLVKQQTLMSFHSGGWHLRSGSRGVGQGGQGLPSMSSPGRGQGSSLCVLPWRGAALWDLLHQGPHPIRKTPPSSPPAPSH